MNGARNAHPRVPIGAQNPMMRTIHLAPDDPPPTPDLAGYSSVEELVKAYRASGSEAKRLAAEVAAERQTRSLLEQQVSQRQPVPQRTDPAARLTEFGVPVDALGEYVGQIVTQAFEPFMKAGTARNTLLSQYPDYQKFESDVARFISEDPSLSAKYQKMFATDPEGALEYAYLKFGQTRKPEEKPTPQTAARSEAQIPSARVGDARTQPAAAQDEQLTRAWEHYQKTGNPTAYAKARLGQVLRDEYMNS